MIKVTNMNIENIKDLGVKRLSFPLMVSRNVWLCDDKLVLEYPLHLARLTNIGEAVTFSLLPIAYREASNIELPDSLPIDQEVQKRIDKICALWNKWFCCNRKVKVLASMREPKRIGKKQRHAAQLFSSGVDALSTFQRQRNNVKYLVFYKGVDIPVTRESRYAEVKKHIEDIAKEHNKELITVSTNAGYLGAASWAYMSQSCMLIGPMFALSEYINKVYIGSSFFREVGMKMPWGSHPKLDPLVESKEIKVVHEGFEFTRAQKTINIAKEPGLLKKLRVCGNIKFYDEHKDNVNRVNCGRCEKCNRTIAVLAILGISDEDVPFPSGSLSLRKVNEFISNWSNIPGFDKPFWSDILELLEASRFEAEGKKELIKTLKRRLEDFYLGYKQGFKDGLPEELLEHISIWRKLEKTIGLEFDSLQWLKKIARSLRGSSYKRFVEKNERFTKI